MYCTCTGEGALGRAEEDGALRAADTARDARLRLLLQRRARWASGQLIQ